MIDKTPEQIADELMAKVGISKVQCRKSTAQPGIYRGKTTSSRLRNCD